MTLVSSVTRIPDAVIPNHHPMVHSSSQNALMRFLSLSILPLLLLSSIWLTGIVSGATPPPPVGFLTGGTFAQYFQNAVNNPCPQYYYVRGFKSLPAGDYMKPDCILGQNIDKWDLSWNAGTTNVNFIGTTDNQPLRIKTNWGDRMLISPTGNVGIYTTTPSSKLDVENRFRVEYGNPIYGAGIAATWVGGGGWARRYWFTTQDWTARLWWFWWLGTDNALSSWWIGNDYNDYALSLDAASKNAHFTGNVGIWTTTPSGPLEIRSIADNGLNLTQTDPADGWNYITYNSNAWRRWWMGTDSTGIFTIYRDGSAATSARIGNADLVVDNKLWIGYSNPGYPLDVNGAARINGNILANGIVRANSDPTYGVNLLSWGLYNNNAAPDKNIYIEPQPGAGLYITPSDWGQNLTTYIGWTVFLGWNTFSFANGTGTIDYYKSWPYDQIEFGTITGSNKDVSFHTNGSSKVWIKPSGNVGIWTNTPWERLDVNGNIRSNGEISVLNWWRLTQAWWSDVVTIHNHLWDGAANNNYGNLALWHGYYYGWLQSGGPTGWEASGYGELYAASKSMLMGNVGVWTAVPEARLTIMQPGNGWNDGINIHSPNAWFATWTILNDGWSAPGFLTIAPNTDYTKSLTINGSDGLVNVHANLWVNGNVGIWTINPSAKLEVAWQVKITGGAPWLGRVLTSDASGLASWWVAPSSFALTNDQWIQSTPDNRNRFYFWNNARTYFWSMNGYSWRNSSDSDIATLSDWGRLKIGENLYTDNNYGYGLVWLYDSTKYQWVFAMGDAYKLPADGSTPGSLYGIAWTHSNVWGESKAWLEHQALFMMNGVTQTAIGNGIWTKGNITAGTTSSRIFLNDTDESSGGAKSIHANSNVIGFLNGASSWMAYWDNNGNQINMWSIDAAWSISSPTYYDRDDTSYYMNPNGGSQINTIYANNWFRAQGDSWFYFQGHGGGFQMTDNTWIQTYNNSSLQVNWNIKITGGAPWPGKILTSDATGLATWTSPVSGMPTVWTAGQTLYSNGTNWMASSNIFNNNGNVGIWTATPWAKLEVAWQVKITGWSPWANKFLMSDASGLATWAALPWAWAETDPEVWANTLNYLSKWNGTALIASSVFDNGDVGIWTATPWAKLDVTSNFAEVANFSSTTPNAYINFYGAGTRKAYISATGANLSIMNLGNGSLTLGTNGLKPFIISGGQVGVHVDDPTADLDIDGSFRLRQGAGNGKILTSDTDGNARWSDAGTTSSAGGWSTAYRTLTTPEDIIPILGWNPMAYTDFMTYYSPLSASCPGWTFKLTVSQREAADWPAVGTTYRFDGWVSYNQFNKDYEVFNSFGNRLHLNVGWHTAGGKVFIDGASVMWWDESPGWGGVQLEAACEGTCSAWYSGPLCDIPPCEDVTLAGGPACETTQAINPTNAKNRNLYRIGEYWGNVHFVMCDDASTNANRTTYADAAIGYMNSWAVPIPNMNFDMEYYWDHWLANNGTTTWQGKACWWWYIPPPDSGGW